LLTKAAVIVSEEQEVIVEQKVVGAGIVQI
jgi:hypothetical protein